MDDLAILRRRLKREQSARHQAETIAEESSRALYLEGQRLTRALAAETQAKRELQVLLDAAEAFNSNLQAEQIAKLLYDLIAAILPCHGIVLHLADTDQDITAGEIPSDLRSGLSLTMMHRDRVVAEVTLCSTEGWQSDPDLRVASALVNAAATAVENSLRFDTAQQQAISDPLTGLLNRRGFWPHANAAVEGSSPVTRPLSALMVDIDHFKAVNDSRGHDAGDQVLATVARVINDATRSQDIVARWGGEEFVVLLPATPRPQASIVAERIRANVEGARIEAADKPVGVTVSIGVSQLEADPDSVRDLLSRTDAALYRAKESGRNQCQVDAHSAS
jgi:diguanylate cyclase (GGDEF)-like protein